MKPGNLMIINGFGHTFWVNKPGNLPWRYAELNETFLIIACSSDDNPRMMYVLSSRGDLGYVSSSWLSPMQIDNHNLYW